jgi:predicted  nucleic acid-binding Zn-ribbon protein
MDIREFKELAKENQILTDNGNIDIEFELNPVPYLIGLIEYYRLDDSEREDLQVEINDLKSQLDNYECDCLDYYDCSHCDEKQSEIDDLESDKESLETDISDLEDRISELEEEIKHLEANPIPKGHLSEQVDFLWKCLALPAYENKEVSS